MSFSQKRRETSVQLAATVQTDILAPAACLCAPLSPLCQPSLSSTEETSIDAHKQSFVPASAPLHRDLRTLLQEIQLETSSLSVLLIHVAQLELSPALQSGLFQRQYTHISQDQLAQIFTNVRRVIRLDDQLCLDDASGGAFVFPDVDSSGIATIVERIYQSINLLQAETILPPLSRATTILLGCASLSAHDGSLEQLFFSLSQPARTITLRPALPRQAMHTPATLPSGIMHPVEHDYLSMPPQTIPFLDLPRDLPIRLKQLLPYTLACELRCAPVGRDQYRLTVAMANPHITEHVKRLAQATGLSIFPVACEIEDLDILLATKW